MKSISEDLRDSVLSIAAIGSNDPEKYKPRDLGPDAFDFIKDNPGNFGPEHDFWTEDDIFFPVSIAAKVWCFSKLPEGLDRVSKDGSHGFRIGQFFDYIVHRAKTNGLMSLEDYTESMEELNSLARQWE